MSTRTLLIAGACLTPLLAGAAAAQQDDWLVATVGDHEIFFSDVQDVIASLPAQYQQLPPQVLVPSIAEQIAVGRVMQDTAYEEGLADDPEVQARLDEAEGAIVQEVWLERAVAARISEERLQEAYTAFLEQNPPVTETRARHILVDTVEAAQSLISELDDGADFVALAQEHSIGPSGQNGGDLGYFTIEQMVPAFAEVAFALDVGTYSEEPVETQFGYHVILVEDRRDVEPPRFEDLEPDLRQQAQQGAMQEVVADLREGLDVTLYGPDGVPLDAPADEAPADEAPATEEPANDATPTE